LVRGNTDDPEGYATNGGARYGAIYGTAGARRPRRAGAHRLGDAPSVDPVTAAADDADPAAQGSSRGRMVTDLRSRRRRADPLPGPRGGDPLPEPRGGATEPGTDPGDETATDTADPAPAGRAWVVGRDGTRLPEPAVAPAQGSDPVARPGPVPERAERGAPDAVRGPDPDAGPPLRELLDRGPVAPEGAVRLGAEVAAALADWHRERGRHGQLTPDSVRLDTDGRVRLVEPPHADDSMDPAAVPYLAPEQVGGGQGGRAGDVYALGLILLEVVTGEPVYPGSSWSAASARLTAPPVVPNEVPGSLAGTVLATTQLDPAARPSAARVAERLGGRPPVPSTLAATMNHGHSGLARMAAFGLPVLVLLALLGVALLGHHRDVSGAGAGDNPAAAPAASTAPASAAAPSAAPTAAAPTAAAPIASGPTASAPSGTVPTAGLPAGAAATTPSIALPSIDSPRTGKAVSDQAGKVTDQAGRAVSGAADKVAGEVSDKADEVAKQAQRQVAQKVADRVTDTWHRFTDWLTGLL
jgi:uncharacterized protein YjbJ (UPF0337 family)